MERSIKAFMDLGQERNRLVHQDYGTFYMEKTSEEIFDMYREALKFVLSVKDFLDDFTELQNSSKSK